jgi:hypothetical protein
MVISLEKSKKPGSFYLPGFVGVSDAVGLISGVQRGKTEGREALGTAHTAATGTSAKVPSKHSVIYSVSLPVKSSRTFV